MRHAQGHENQCYCNLCVAVDLRAEFIEDIKASNDREAKLNHIIDMLEELRGERL